MSFHLVLHQNEYKNSQKQITKKSHIHVYTVKEHNYGMKYSFVNFSFFIFDWQNLNMIISIFNLSHTNTWNTYQSYTGQTEGAAEADGRRSVVREDRVRAGHHGVQKRG